MIFPKEMHETILLIFTFAGLLISIFSILEKHVQWVASFCAFFGEGCRKTEDFTLFGIPISWWGVCFYVGLGAVVFIAKPLVFWVVMAALGMELTFAWIMVKIRAFCIFCMFNAIAVAGLVLVTLDPARIWQAVSIALIFFMISKYLLSIENVSEISGSREAERKPDVLAKIEGRKITSEEVEKPLSRRIYEHRMKIYRMKKERLEKMIRKILLEKEAERQGFSLQELLDSIPENLEVSDEEVESYYRENQEIWKDWDESEKEIKQRIRDLLRNRKHKESVTEYADGLKDRYEVAIFLKEPRLPLTQVRVEDNPETGPANAPVTVVEFSDYLCPACRGAHETARQIRENFEGKIRWIFKDFPMEQHPGAKKMAKAAHCAREQGKFWKYQDLLFSSDGKPEKNILKQYASRLSLDLDRFEQCLEKDRYRNQIEEDIEDGKDAGISGTPTFIINGKMISGALSIDEFSRMIEEELERIRGGSIL